MSSDPSPIATVNGRVVERGQIVDLLMRSHGAGILEQLIALEAAEALAAQKGVYISDADVDREYVLALRRVSNPIAAVTPKDLDRAAAERLLESVLAERSISREEFFITLRRNAYLRKLVELGETVTDEELQTEYARRYGPRVQVRHIQTASLSEAERMHARLSAGEDFAELAKAYSADTASARDGGMLDPFSTSDEDVPPILRQTAFSLQLWQISGIVRAGAWHHILRLERRIPEEHRPFDEVSDELASAVRDRRSEARMRELHEKLLREAVVEVRDPALREAYERRRGARDPAGGNRNRR